MRGGMCKPTPFYFHFLQERDYGSDYFNPNPLSVISMIVFVTIAICCQLAIELKRFLMNRKDQQVDRLAVSAVFQLENAIVKLKYEVNCGSEMPIELDQHVTKKQTPVYKSRQIFVREVCDKQPSLKMNELLKVESLTSSVSQAPSKAQQQGQRENGVENEQIVTTDNNQCTVEAFQELKQNIKLNSSREIVSFTTKTRCSIDASMPSTINRLHHVSETPIIKALSCENGSMFVNKFKDFNNRGVTEQHNGQESNQVQIGCQDRMEMGSEFLFEEDTRTLSQKIKSNKTVSLSSIANNKPSRIQVFFIIQANITSYILIIFVTDTFVCKAT
jgi:hypothetical protein